MASESGSGAGRPDAGHRDQRITDGQGRDLFGPNPAECAAEGKPTVCRPSTFMQNFGMRLRSLLSENPLWVPAYGPRVKKLSGRQPPVPIESWLTKRPRPGSIQVRQCPARSGTFLGEAIRPAIRAVANTDMDAAILRRDHPAGVAKVAPIRVCP